MKARHGRGLFALAAALLFGSAMADEAPLHLVAAYAPGGSGDQIARLVGAALSQQLGVAVIVDNKAGAGGGIAAEFVAKSPADGKTFLVGSNGPLVINKAVYSKLAYDPERDFTPVVALAETPLLLVTRKDLGVGSLADLQALAKKRAGTPLTMGSAGNGNITHLAGVFISDRLGFKVLHVPYKGSAPAIAAMLGGEIDIMYDALPSSLPQARAGKLQPLAVTTPTRLAVLPDTPTLKELGFDVGKATAWFGLVAPAKTPPAVIQKINAAVNKALADAVTREKLLAIGFVPMGGSAQDFGALIKTELQRWVPLARSLDVRAD